MRKFILFSLFFMSCSFAHAYGMKYSTSIYTARNHQVLSTGCIAVDAIVPLSTATGAAFSVAVSSDRNFDYYQATTYTLTDLAPKPGIDSFYGDGRGLMINTLALPAGQYIGSWQIIYHFDEASCIDFGNALAR